MQLHGDAAGHKTNCEPRCGNTRFRENSNHTTPTCTRVHSKRAWKTRVRHFSRDRIHCDMSFARGAHWLEPCESAPRQYAIIPRSTLETQENRFVVGCSRSRPV